MRPSKDIYIGHRTIGHINRMLGGEWTRKDGHINRMLGEDNHTRQFHRKQFTKTRTYLLSLALFVETSMFCCNTLGTPTRKTLGYLCPGST
jgi:hypothetical protein